MGDDVDFFDLEGVADPRLVAAFRPLSRRCATLRLSLGYWTDDAGISFLFGKVTTLDPTPQGGAGFGTR